MERIFEGGGNPSQKPTSRKDLVIWENRNKAYALIATYINEEVIHHITHFIEAFGALRKLKELYDSHSELEVV